MPYFPIIKEAAVQRESTDAFLGYNHNLRIGNGEFYDMKNLTGSYYPVLSPRGKRGIYAEPLNAQGMISKDALCYVDGTDFVINRNHVSMGLSVAPEDCPKQLISMGAYVIIMPDKKYINTKDLTDFGNIEAHYESAGTVTFSMCKVDGSAINQPTVSPSEPSSPNNMDLWMDTSSTPHTLKQYSASSKVWTTVLTTYVKIQAQNIGKAFEKFDGVTISGVTVSQLTDLNGTVTIYDRGDDYIVVVGILDTSTSQSTSITVDRKMPNMEFVIENENRLWGCHYGVALNGEVVNEIYCSKLGDFKNWNSFLGISTDSYVVSCGTDGEFTGAVALQGYPIFFKENCLHKIYGSYPAQFQVKTTACRGVQRGCSRSLAIVNEVLYYKGRNAICSYDGSLPVEMSEALGEEKYSEAVAGSNGNKYYISMKDQAGGHQLFVYDTAKGFWHREDNTQVDSFCSCDGEMYFIDHADGKIKTELGSGTPEEDPVEWEAVTGVQGLTTTGMYGNATVMPDHKYISRLIIRMSLAIGSKVTFSIQYDSQPKWEHLFTVTGKSLRSFSVPVLPRRCDHFRLKIAGKGDAKIYSIVKNVEQGSDA